MPRMTPEAKARLEAFKAVKVRHARLLETHERVTQVIEEHAGSAYLWMYGPGGVGKSTVVHQVKEQFRADEPNRAIEPVVLVEARASDIGAYVRLDYYRQVLQALKGHAIVDEMLANIAAKSKASRVSRHLTEWLEMREYVETALSYCLVKGVMIDEAQHLLQGHRPLEQLDWLKSMSNKTNVLHVLTGTYDLVDFSVLDGQMARRGRDLHFPRYHGEKETERAEFIGALQYLLERLPLSCDVKSWLSHWRWFAEGSIGCVGVLKDWLVETVRMIFAEQGTTLSMEALSRAAPGPSNRVRMERDARAGEHKVAMEQAESRRLMQVLFGKASLDQISEPITRRERTLSAYGNETAPEPSTALPPRPREKTDGWV